MENFTVDVERIEQELQELRSRFSKADIVLRGLEEIQIDFEDLAITYKQLKEYVSEVSRFNKESNEIIKLIQQAQTNFEQRFEKLKEENEVKTKQIHDELNSHRSLIAQAQTTFEQRFEQLRKLNEVKTEQINRELNNHCSSIDKLNQTLAENQDLLHQFSSDLTNIKKTLDFSSTTTKNLRSEIEKITNVDGELSKVNKEIRIHKKDMRIMRNAMIGLLILWLCLGAFVLMK
jgi:chromosome segregation ATPase